MEKEQSLPIITSYSCIHINKEDPNIAEKIEYFWGLLSSWDINKKIKFMRRKSKPMKTKGFLKWIDPKNPLLGVEWADDKEKGDIYLVIH